MDKETLFVSFSGGRTSGYMCHWLLENKADEYDLRFVFANTGIEHENSLDFVDRCDKEFKLDLTWVEAVVNPEHGKGIRHKIVTYETAARKGEPFEAFIAKSGVPNKAYNQCSGRLKEFVMNSYRRELGFRSNHQTAIGIRSDEFDRMSDRADELGLIYPLVRWTIATKASVRHWWAVQSFDLDLPEHLGNCVTCWKKSDRKLMTIAKHEPERFEFFARMEREHSHIKCDEKPRLFFRRHRSAQDILAEAQQPFIEFKDEMPEYQLDMIGLDAESDCGATTCEIA